jgi:hypothetical protein
MEGPFEFADFIYMGLGRNDQVFRPGRYRVISAFCDNEGFQHRPGDEWLLMFAGFNKFDEEKVLFVSLDEKHQWMIPLSWMPNGQQDVIEHFSRYAEWIGPLPAGFPPPKTP